MLLAIDIGNTNVSFGLFKQADTDDQDNLVFASRISLQKNRSADEYAVLIKQILDLHLLCDYTITRAAISSVVPSLTNIISHTAEILSGRSPYIIRSGIKTGFKISINDPACLGADIVANTAAALQICKPPIMIFDAGTANTITVIDDSATLIGTVIMPGIGISSESLHHNTELLDSIPIDSDDLPLIGKNTEQAVRSGIINGTSLMIDGFARSIRESMISKDSDKKLSLIATGGFAKIIIKNCRNKFYLDDTLTLKGIASLYYKNSKNFV